MGQVVRKRRHAAAAHVDAGRDVFDGSGKSLRFVIDHEVQAVKAQSAASEHPVVRADPLTRMQLGAVVQVVFQVELTNITEDLAGKSNMILFKATTSISRSEFGMDTLSSVASDTVKICMSVEALKYQS